MRTYKDIMAGPVGSSSKTTRSTPTSDVPVNVVVDGEELDLTLDTGLTPTESAAAKRSDDPVNTRNGSL
jgi:hypothetical protein